MIEIDGEDAYKIGVNLKLIGHTNALGNDIYPTLVIPIGNLKNTNTLYSARLSEGGSFCVTKLDEGYFGEGRSDVIYDDELRKNLSRFNFISDQLFAFSNTDVTFFHYKSKAHTYKHFLETREIESPVMELNMAYTTNEPILIYKAIKRRVRSMKGMNTLKQFYQEEIDKLKSRDFFGLVEILEQPGKLEEILNKR